MGTPIEPIIILPGTDCLECWGNDKPFGLITPDTLFLTLDGWQEGNLFQEAFREELDNAQALFQDSLNPCFFAALSTNFTWIYEVAPAGTLIQVRPFPPGVSQAFAKTSAAQCQKILTNAVISPVSNVAFGGTASVYFGSPP